MFLFVYTTENESFSFCIPKIVVESNVGKKIRNGSYANTGWYFDISIAILTSSTITLSEYLKVNSNQTSTAKIKVYYK